MNVKLLCRRYELARASDMSLDMLEPVVQEHAATCSHCQALQALDTRIAAALQGQTKTLPPPARARIIALAKCELDEQYPARYPTFRPLVVVATALLLCAFSFAYIQPHKPVFSAIVDYAHLGADGWHVDTESLPRGRASAETMKRLALADIPTIDVSVLVDAHRYQRASSLSFDGVRSLSLPVPLAEIGPTSQGQHVSPVSIVDATLFVVHPERIELSSDVLDALADGRLARLRHGLHTVAISERDDRVFVVVTTPGGEHNVAVR